MTTLLEWDYAIFNLINHTCSNGFLDAIMPHWRDMEFWYPFYGMLVLYFFISFPWKQALVLLLFLLATIAITDSIGNYGFKETIERPRPCQTTEHVQAHTLVKCGHGFSFVSNHAANHSAIAVFLIVTIGFISRYFNYFMVFWALSIGLGQIYVGVHYPTDVLAGFLLGSIVGGILGKITLRLVDVQKI